MQEKNLHLENKANNKIHIRYLSTENQEIIDVIGFDFDSMFSGMEGVVGTFLKYSLLEMAEMLNSVVFGTSFDFYFEVTSLIQFF